MSERRRWTEEDAAKLRSMAGSVPSEEIARALGRGLLGTRMKAHKLKVSLSIRRRRGSLPDQALNAPT